MAGTNEVVYDPTDYQLRDLDRMLEAAEGLSVADLAKKPEAILLILRQQAAQLYELRASKNEIVELRTANMELRDDRESLRIGLAKLQERESVSLIEIPISIASGFAINMLTSNIQSGFGWLLLILSLSMLSVVRKSQLNAFLQRVFPSIRRQDENEN
jgi:hypothetical protein